MKMKWSVLAGCLGWLVRTLQRAAADGGADNVGADGDHAGRYRQ